MSGSRYAGMVLAAAFLLALAGCSIGPKCQPPAMPAPAAYKESPSQFKETDGWKIAQPSRRCYAANGGRSLRIQS
jgi:hypothetical protein